MCYGTGLKLYIRLRPLTLKLTHMWHLKNKIKSHQLDIHEMSSLNLIKTVVILSWPIFLCYKDTWSRCTSPEKLRSKSGRGVILACYTGIGKLNTNIKSRDFFSLMVFWWVSYKNTTNNVWCLSTKKIYFYK